jgi:release factor glutamine methyltransferase
MNAELLLMFILGCDRAHLYGHPERELTADELQRYEETIARRATGVPAQYITGHQEFWGLDLIVSPAVLIPRPETEHVVETVLGLAKGDNHGGHGATRGTAVKNLRLVDVGTGSGAIAIAIAKEFPEAEVHATDVSTEALEVARANAARHELSPRIKFHQTDLLAGLSREAFDFIVSNPPYVGSSEEETVQLEVRKFEPRNAVFAGETGLEVIERLVPQAADVLGPEGWLVLEISGTIADGVRRLLGGWSDVAITNDLQGIPRVARARKRGNT